MYRANTKQDFVNYLRNLEHKLYDELQMLETKYDISSDVARLKRAKWATVCDMLDDLGITPL